MGALDGAEFKVVCFGDLDGAEFKVVCFGDLDGAAVGRCGALTDIWVTRLPSKDWATTGEQERTVLPALGRFKRACFPLS